ncbi:MAG: hypothetical protein K8F52_02620 [Candidatus Scalindua rubra]|nr:hypothetical protein [Candidatus Scalindua rubra]
MSDKFNKDPDKKRRYRRLFFRGPYACNRENGEACGYNKSTCANKLLIEYGCALQTKQKTP